MPLRLLGLIPDLESLGDLGGLAFARYAQTGVTVTVACAGGEEGERLKSRARALGIHAVVMADYRPAERGSAGLSELFADIIRAIQPHVVVVSAWDEAVRSAGLRAFGSAREAARGSAGLPAKLYLRFPADAGSSTVSTAVPVASGESERFQRVYPVPWVTGVLERDLFAGLGGPTQAPMAPLDERLAS